MIFYGSQTGTAEEYAVRLAKDFEQVGLASLVADPEAYDMVLFSIECIWLHHAFLMMMMMMMMLYFLMLVRIVGFPFAVVDTLYLVHVWRRRANGQCSSVLRMAHE